MVKKVEISGMGQEVRRFFEELAAEGQPYLLVEDQGKPLVGVVPPWQISRIEEQREQLMSMLKDVWARNRNVPPEEIEQEVEEVVRELRGDPRR
jgi:hypothetical protein